MKPELEAGMYVILCGYNETCIHSGISENTWEQLRGVCKIKCIDPPYIMISSMNTNSLDWWVSWDTVTPFETEDIIQYDTE